MKMKIKEARERANLTQTELASRVGVAPNTFNGYENGLHDPKSGMLIKISRECNTSIDFLLGLTDDPRATDEKEKSPAPEGTEDDQISIEEMKKLLCAIGLGDKIDNLSEKDVLFLSGIFKMLDAWFG